jgi:hypothetical protein
MRVEHPDIHGKAPRGRVGVTPMRRRAWWRTRPMTRLQAWPDNVSKDARPASLATCLLSWKRYSGDANGLFPEFLVAGQLKKR